jgi:hypothetical protein
MTKKLQFDATTKSAAEHKPVMKTRNKKLNRFAKQ